MSNFIDYIRVFCKSGKGGAGSRHFLREKFIDRGGPDGGDGGRGGHIILRGDEGLWTLLHLRYTKHLIAEDGQSGGGNRATGSQGEDLYINVPLGTIVKNEETGEVLLEITQHGEEKILFHGGKGGLGNDHFKTSTRQTPDYAQPGEPGTEAWVVMELKVLADVGMVGLPNAGKSTLLSVISAAKPKIADYPFTTIVPNLGVVSYRDHRSFVVADIPGIIEGASEGKGLGLRFLRHIERNSVLLFMIAADSNDIKAEFALLRNELAQYNPELLDKDYLLAITKADLLDAELRQEIAKELADMDFIFISSITGYNIAELKDRLWAKLKPATN